MIVTNSASATHVGMVRDHQEDAFYVGERVWAVADGMGGHAAGEVASGIAVEAMRELDRTDGVLDRDAVVAAVVAAAQRVRSHGFKHRRALGLGTTLTGAALVADAGAERLCVFNLGDSRAYALGGQGMSQVSTDHSEVAEMIEAGLITPEDARTHPLRNLVTRCLGMYGPVLVDTWLLEPEVSRLLLCSDGLNGELTDDRIETLLGAGDPQAASDALVAAAVQAGGHDNVTVVVVDVGTGPHAR